LVEAAEIYREILRERPTHAAALNNLGALQLQTGAAAAAVATLSIFVAQRPRDPIGYSNLGHALVQAGRAAEAEVALRQAVELAPGFAQAYNHLGMALVVLDRMAEGTAAFARALELHPRLVDAARNLGRVLNDAGEGLRAAAAYRAWLRVDPDNPDARAGLALAEAMQGNLGEASKALEQLAALPACSAATWQTLGVVQYWDGRLVEAETAARKALALEPGSSDAAFLVAASLLGREDYRNGWREFERRTEGSLGNSVRFPD
jgi:Flp pilus assembly protein TadD